MKKSEVINNKDRITKEWKEFFRESVEHPDYPESDIITTNENYERFGEMMYKYFLYEVGLEDSNRDNLYQILPSGTECRTYYRLFCCVYGIGNYQNWKVNINSCNGFQDVGIIFRWFESGVITPYQLCDMIDWRPIIDKQELFSHTSKEWIYGVE